MPKLIALAAVLALFSVGAAGAQESPGGSVLARCAGALAAHGGLDVLRFPQGASGEWAPALSAVLEALNREPGLEGMTGRYAASAARTYWLEQTRAARARAAEECRTRFAPTP